MIEGMELAETIEIAASPQAVYDTIRQLERMGEWSPENTGGTWQSGDGSTIGDVFVGHNVVGDRQWDAPATITACEPGQQFAFSVPDDDDPVARWAYDLAPTDGGGCEVTERWEMHRAPPSMVDKPREVLEARRSAVQAGMRTTLEALKASIEAD